MVIAQVPELAVPVLRFIVWLNTPLMLKVTFSIVDGEADALTLMRNDAVLEFVSSEVESEVYAIVGADASIVKVLSARLPVNET